MRILNFGSCNIDYVYSVDHIAQPGETIAAAKKELELWKELKKGLLQQMFV